jgi:hypothetical protein
MKIQLVIIMLVTILSGCATSQKVTLGQMGQHKKLSTAALVTEEGNSKDMDSELRQQLLSYGIESKQPLPTGTRQSKDIDVIVEYSDVWRWDIVMYLKSLTINLFDAQTGNLIVTGNWENSALHKFRNSREVIKDLLDDMIAKATTEAPEVQASK